MEAGDPSAKKTAFDFYNAYLAVVYGLVVTEGLQEAVKFTDPVNWQLVNGLLFLGTFVVSLHFWFVCATVDDLSQNFYVILSGKKSSEFDLLLLFDALVATTFAGLALTMFHAVSQKWSRFFVWLCFAAALSLVYDLYSSFLVFLAGRPSRRRGAAAGTQHAVERYRRELWCWVIIDAIFFVLAAGMLLYDCRGIHFFDCSDPRPRSKVLGAFFAAITILLLLSDAKFWLLWKREEDSDLS